MQPVLSPWAETFDCFIQSIRECAIIAAPFIAEKPLRKLASQFHKENHAQFSLLTNLSADSLLQKTLDTKAIASFCKSFPETTVHHLPGLHAKVYIADKHTAIVTSGNLTANSLHRNFEYGIRIHDPVTVEKITDDLISYRNLGSLISTEDLDHLTELSEVLRSKYANTINSARAGFKKDFENQLEAIDESLRELRGAPGESTNSIFTRTLLYLLNKEPLRTRDIHPLIRNIHPDLCDDRTDRVIRGIHFGREWKHRVRGAQVDLRRKGLIELVEGKWRLVRRE